MGGNLTGRLLGIGSVYYLQIGGQISMIQLSQDEELTSIIQALFHLCMVMHNMKFTFLHKQIFVSVQVKIPFLGILALILISLKISFCLGYNHYFLFNLYMSFFFYFIVPFCIITPLVFSPHERCYDFSSVSLKQENLNDCLNDFF